MKGFISYAHDDHRMFGEFRPHLTAIERAYGIELWADPSIHAGHHWNSVIQQAIDAAEVFILLISPAFIASSFIYDIEIPAIQTRLRSTGGLVLPVVLRRCCWSLVCKVLQAVPTNGAGRLTPISDWRQREHGYDRAREQIAAAIEHHCHLTPTTVGWTVP